MLILDQLRKDDPHLRWLSVLVLAGLGVLAAGLWWVQIVSARDYQAHFDTQSFRTVRIPAVRGSILDRNGAVLAENRAVYNVSLYLEELRKGFDAAAGKQIARAQLELKQSAAARQRELRRQLTREERKQFVLSAKDRDRLRKAARYAVASNVVAQAGQWLRQPLTLNPTNFERHFETSLALPFPILTNLNATQIALFKEQSTNGLGVDLELQSMRNYPGQTTAAHVLGSLKRDDRSAEGEEAFFSYRLPDYRGQLGIEFGFDRDLRGTAGSKTVMVNSLGYRQTENIWSAGEAGQNVVLTIDLAIQQAIERALPIYGPKTRGAAVVMDVRTGDILAMASSPTINPNYSIQGFPPGEWQRRLDPILRPEINRATQENYAPGSIFKTVVGLAALEAGLNPKQKITIAADPLRRDRGIYYVGRQPFHDTAPPGEHDFLSALKLSSNSYFISNGLWAGIASIARLSQQLHLGERCGLPTLQETSGIFPSARRRSANWFDGHTANLCIGQGELAVTPLQMAVLTAAIANGGTVLSPRLVDRLEKPGVVSGEPQRVFPSACVRDHLGVQPRHLEVLREAMLADVEDPDGTGREAAVRGLRICGKTGTAQVKDTKGVTIDHTTWFISFAPYSEPRYAVVVMIEGGTSGGGTCAPIAKQIYNAIRQRERLGPAPSVALKD